MNPIKVLVVDDSAFMRRVISSLLSGDEDITVTATARDGRDALLKIEKFKPDVITLGVEMPVMNGLEVLKTLMGRTPLPVIMFSSHTQRGSRITMEALALGAVDFVPKPDVGQHIHSVEEELKRKIKTAASAINLSSLPRKQQPKPERPSAYKTKGRYALVAMGASTGGPSALEKILTALPAAFPVPIMITQHMPAGFTRAFAERLDTLCQIKVREAEHGEPLQKATAFIAPGGYHLVTKPDGKIYLNQDPPVEHVRPSVNVMLESAVTVYAEKIIGVILTGMGKDGADAMVSLKNQGGRTIVQDEGTSIIFSMPKAVIDRNAADIIAPVQDIPGILTEFLL